MLELGASNPNVQESAGGGARTHTALRPLDFESSASANSATPASARFDTTKRATKLKFQSRFQLRSKNPFCVASLSHGDRCETPPVYKKLRSGATANIWSHHEMKLEGVVREKLGVLFRRFVLFAQNSGDELWEYVRENLAVLFRRFLLFAWDVRCDHANNHDAKLRAKLEWPHVMNSSIAMHGPLVSGTWIWHHQLARWHHGYYRTRR